MPLIQEVLISLMIEIENFAPLFVQTPKSLFYISLHLSFGLLTRSLGSQRRRKGNTCRLASGNCYDLLFFSSVKRNNVRLP